MISMSDEEFVPLQAYLREACGIDVPPEKRYLFETRLGELLRDEKCLSFTELYNRLAERRGVLLRARLVDAMATNETSFFRDGHPFDVLERDVLPRLYGRRLAETGGARPGLRLLCAGCSSGEEPYSLAMVLGDWARRQPGCRTEQASVLGIDVSRTMLEQARRAIYPAERVEGAVPTRFREQFLQKEDGRYEVIPELRSLVTFRELSLAVGVEFLGRFDVIFCRNVLIYFSEALRRRLLQAFFRMLLPGGALFLGATEGTYGTALDFETVHATRTTYYAKP